MKIVILDAKTLNDLDWNELKKLGDCTFYDRTPADQDEIVNRIGEAEIILTNKVTIDAEIMGRTPNLKYIGELATGYNNIDLDAAKNHGITVTNIPSYASDSVAQSTFALLLEITNQVGAHNKSVHDGDWTNSPDFSYWITPLMEIQNKTIGLIGFGNIAQKVAEIAHAFSMNVIYWNHRPKSTEHSWAKQVQMDELLATSDIISLHVPQSKDTMNIINENTIKQMKDNMILLNTSRGGLLNEKDVADALNSGKIYAAGLDVVSTEPIKEDNPLLTAKNCFITPHIAWAPKETRTQLLNIAINNVKNYIENKPSNVVSNG